MPRPNKSATQRRKARLAKEDPLKERKREAIQDPSPPAQEFAFYFDVPEGEEEDPHLQLIQKLVDTTPSSDPLGKAYEDYVEEYEDVSSENSWDDSGSDFNEKMPKEDEYYSDEEDDGDRSTVLGGLKFW